MDNTEYKPIAVETAKQIAEHYQKDIVIILATDTFHDRFHCTTYGVTPPEKALAAAWGELAAGVLGVNLDRSKAYEDYRLERAKELLAALKTMVKLAGEVQILLNDSNFDEDTDSRTDHIGDTLLAMSGYQPRYREDIDAIHETIKRAEEFLGATP